MRKTNWSWSGRKSIPSVSHVDYSEDETGEQRGKDGWMRPASTTGLLFRSPFDHNRPSNHNQPDQPDIPQDSRFSHSTAPLTNTTQFQITSSSQISRLPVSSLPYGNSLGDKVDLEKEGKRKSRVREEVETGVSPVTGPRPIRNVQFESERFLIREQCYKRKPQRQRSSLLIPNIKHSPKADRRRSVGPGLIQVGSEHWEHEEPIPPDPGRPEIRQSGHQRLLVPPTIVTTPSPAVYRRRTIGPALIEVECISQHSKLTITNRPSISPNSDAECDRESIWDPNLGLEVDLVPKFGLEANLVPKFGLEANLVPKFGLEANLVPKFGLEANLVPKVERDPDEDTNVDRRPDRNRPFGSESNRNVGSSHLLRVPSPGARSRSHSITSTVPMHSPSYLSRRSTADYGAAYNPDEDCQFRKHSYVDPSCYKSCHRMAELRRIASSASCRVDNGQRRRILPPTPDQLSMDRGDRWLGNASSSSSSLPSQQAEPTRVYRSAGFKEDSTSAGRRIESPQLAHKEIAGIGVKQEQQGDSDKTEEQIPRQCVFQFNVDDDEDEYEDEEMRRSLERTRRATAIADAAMIKNPSNSPRTGQGRKLPQTPSDSKTIINEDSNSKMTAPPVSRQRTVGDLLRQQAKSPTSPDQFALSTPRRISEQIFNYRNPKPIVSFIKLQNQSKSSPDNDDRKNSRPKSPEQYPFQIPPSRPRSGFFGQCHQSSVSSSSSVPDLITTPPNPNSISGPAGGHVVDPATDSGHGSGAESGVGDGTTVSNSNSWHDTIAMGSTPGTPVAASDQHGVQGLGSLHFSIQYFPVRKRLRVSVMKVEKLAGRLRMDLELHTFVKVCLMPGKIQKQRGSRIVKRSRDASFNEEFFFDNITADDLESRWIYVRLCHHVGKQFQKDVVIGQVEVSLKETMAQLMAKQELKLCQELKPKQVKKLGRLQISTCLEHEARRLTINIFRVDDLPKFGISGAPDPFVRIVVDQNGKIQTKQSRILKNTCNAVFKEAVMFLVSTTKEDLDGTKVVITVHDHARAVAGDDTIGQVYLGQLATDKTEIDQWRNTITNPGREYKTTHQLKREPNVADDDSTSNFDGD